MGSTSSKTSSFDDNITVDLYSSDTTNQLLKNHLTNQRLSDILQHPLASISTINSCISSSSITMSQQQQEEEKLYYTSLVNNNNDIMTRVCVAQCKIYGFGTQKNVTEGFRELYQLKNYKESYYPLACYYYDICDYKEAYAWFSKDDEHFAKYRMALMLFQGQVSTDLEKAFHYMTCSANEGNQYAQFILGVYYQHGILVKQADLQIAKMWYERSANQGFAEAQTAMSNLLINNQLVNDDNNKVLSQENKDMINQALDWLYKAESQENASALIRLGSLHEEGILVQQDYSKAINYYKRATKSPYASTSVLSLAHYLVGINYRLGDLGLEQDYKLALNHLTVSADIGYAPAQRALGLMYAKGIGTPKDPNKARSLFESAAAQGDVRSLGLIADNNNHGNNLKSAMALYEKAAKAGNLASQISLAQLLQRTGRQTVAFKWFEIASKSTPTQLSTTTVDQRRSLLRRVSNSNKKKERISILDFSIGFLSQRNTARLMVARYRYNGWGGVKQDPLWAFEEFRSLSIEENFSDAHYWLAACYEEGVLSVDKQMLVKPDLDLAFELYTKAAVAGDVDSQFQVAYMLSNGYVNKKGQLVKDMEAAFPWYVKAAEHGHKTAQYSVGLYYENGLFTTVDIKLAVQWYELAAKGDMTLAMVRLARLSMVTHDEEETVITSSTDNRLVEAFHWLRKAISNGDVSALRELATFYKNGLIADDDDKDVSQQRYRIAFELFQQAADKDDAMSWHALSKFYEGRYQDDTVVENVDDLVVPVNFEKAVSCLKKAEELGYSVAGLDLADLYYRNDMMEETLQVYTQITNTNDIKSTIGWKARLEMAKIVVFENSGTKLDHLKVYSWLTNMASSNHGFAAASEIFEMLGYCLENGIGTSINKKESTRWYVACCEQEDDGYWLAAKQRSLCRLVNTYMEEKDYQSAFTCLEKLKPSLDDDEMSQLSLDQARRMKYYLGYLLMYGLGTTEKVVVQESISWLAEAADQGEGDAAYELGRFLAFTGHDDEQVRDRYEQGIMLDHAGCMRALALVLLSEENDQCVPDDQDVYDGGAEILRLLQHATELEDTEAIYQLGLAHENGLGTVISNKDIEKALEFYIKAATRNHELAMIKAGEVLGNSLGRHPEAIHWFRKAVDLTGNIKAKVMLVSYDFQGFTSSSNKKQHGDIHNFEVLQSIIDQEIVTMKKGNTLPLSNQHEREERLSMSRIGLGLAFYILGQCYELGRGTSVNLSLAKEWYHRSVLISQHVDAMWRLGVIYSTLEGNDVSALEWFRNAAEKGRHRESHYQLGLFHLKGLGGLDENTIAAQKYFSKASDQDHPLATYELARIVWNRDHIYGYELFKLAGQLHVPGALRELGHLSHTGFSFHGIHIVNQDYKRAFAYYCEAAQMGDPTAALMVGNYFEEGYLKEELGQDCERALQWYESAYRLNGGGLAELAIGKLKHTMADIMTDPKEAEDMREEAFVWFESAANDNIQGAYAAKVMVALYHLHGWGRKPQDAKTGFNMLLDIAESGGSEAFVSVARCYEEGIGTEHNMMKAMDYWELAADMDDQGALIRVGEIYELGLLGPVDKETASSYYNRAEIIGSRNSNSRKRNSGYSIESMSSSSSSLF